MESSAQSLTVSWSDLAPSERKETFRKVVARVEEVQSYSDVRWITQQPVDDHLPTVVAAMEKKLEPCGAAAALEAVQLACQILRCRMPEGDALAGYVALLADYPRDLLMPSIREALKKEQYHVLPTPGALAAVANAELAARRRTYSAARTAMNRLSVARMFNAKLKGRASGR